MFFHLSSTTLFRIYMYHFQFLGLCPTEVSHSIKLNFTILTMISLIHIILLTLVVILVHVYCRDIFFDDDIFGKFNDCSKYIGAVIAYYAIIIESFLKRGNHSKIWSLLAHCHHKYRIDEVVFCKLWNPKQFNLCYFGSYKDSYKTI